MQKIVGIFIVLFLGISVLYAGKGKVRIASDREGAYVYVDGKKKAMTGEGFTSILLDEGEHKIEVVENNNDVLLTGRSSKNIFVGEDTSIKLSLTPSAPYVSYKFKSGCCGEPIVMDEEYLYLSQDNRIEVIQLSTGKLIRSINENDARISVLKLFGNTLYAGDKNGVVVIYDTKKNVLLKKLKTGIEYVHGIDVDPNLIAIAHDKAISVWNKDTFTIVKKLNDFNNYTFEVKLYNQNLIVGGRDDFRIFDLDTNRYTIKLAAHEIRQINAVGNGIFFTGQFLFDVNTNKIIKKFQNYYGYDNNPTTLVKNNTLMFTTKAYSIDSYSLDTKTEETLVKLVDTVRCLIKNDKYLFSIDTSYKKGQYIMAYNFEDGSVKTLLTELKTYRVELLANNHYLVAQSGDGEIRIWDLLME